jgi:nicotinate-nucleotide adenylyltransferase
MTVGLLGGAFDPPHNGHVVLAAEAIRHFGLEILVVVVTGEPPHKRVETDAETRYALAAAAFGDRPGMQLSRFELESEGPSYTVRTARWARAAYGDVVFVVGADEFADFGSWHDPDGVLEEVRLGVATRPGYPRARLDAVLGKLDTPERVEVFEIPAFAASSTEVRERVSRGERIDDLVPTRVAELIATLGLYRG